MLRYVSLNLKSHWRPLVATDLVFRAVAFVMLTPLVGLLFRCFLFMSGRTVLADTDIAKFLLHPMGWLAVIVTGAATICLLALEQAVLMTMSLASVYDQQISVPGSFRIVGRQATGIFQIALRMVGVLFLIAAPFVAVGGGLFLLLLTEHDINFYLTQKPPQYWFAVVLIGTLLAVLVAILIRCVVSWSIAIPLHLFENVSPGECLKTSCERITGHRKTIASWVIMWLVINTIISSMASAVVIALGRSLVSNATGSLWALVTTLGAVLSLWALVNLACSLLAVISFALLLTEIYNRFGKSERFSIPGSTAGNLLFSINWTPFRTVLALIVAAGIAGGTGLAAIHSVRLDDDVKITAHRGASGKAPENTMAAVRQAIEDGADWVEIDVQESKDGVVLVAHDSDFMKVTGVPTKLWEGTAEELQSIDIGSYFDTKFKDERVPTLADVLTECRGKVGVNIELKYYGHDQDLEKKVVDLVEQHEMESDVVIMSLKSNGIQKIKALRPEWTVGLLTAVKAGDLTRVDADFLAVNSNLATRSFIRSAHAKGKQVYVWTLNDVMSMSTMISRGADNLITDHPELAKRVLNDRAGMSPAERVLIELAFLFGVVTDNHSEQ